MRFPFTTYIEVGETEIELAVVYDVTPFVPARLYGDYPHPAEGGEVELISVKHNGTDFPLTDEQEAALIAECEERAGEDLAEEVAAAEEYRAEARREDALMSGWNDED